MKDWIETKDSFPSERTPVIIFNGHEMAHATMKGGKWYMMNTYPEIWIDTPVTHWMGMPNKPPINTKQ